MPEPRTVADHRAYQLEVVLFGNPDGPAVQLTCDGASTGDLDAEFLRFRVVR